MGWLPFGKKRKIPDVILKDTRSWLNELREVCERHHDQPEAARIRIRELKMDWSDAISKTEMDEVLFQGLVLRANKLLRSDDLAFMILLDEIEFWKPGWRP
jgi:hypothetical protein